MKRLTSLVILIICFTAGLNAQIVNPVSWSTVLTTDSIKGEGSILITADIQDGYHIYGFEQVKNGPIATSISFEPTSVTLVGELTPSAKPTKKFSDQFNLDIEEWSGKVIFTQKFKYAVGSSAQISGTIKYMACKGNACFPPAKETFNLILGNLPISELKNDEKLSTNTEQTSDNNTLINSWWTPVAKTQISGAEDLSGNISWWSILFLGFAGGLLALLTPCVWPMIPMTLSFFLKKSKKRSQSILEAVLYGFSIVAIFLILGIAITLLFGAGKLNEIATSAGFNVFFFLMLVVFAISFFGAFDIKLPSKWSNAVDNKAESATGFLSIFFMAFTLVLVSFSCTGPIIGTLLVEAASNGSILGPALGMGGFALGLAIPFSLFAFFPSLLNEMPRSGGWMNSVKVVLGFIELILSLKFLSVADLAYGWHILDREVFLSIWIVLFILLGLYLLGKLRFSHDSESKHSSVFGFFLAIISFSFAVYLLPGLWGAPLKAVSAFAPPLSTQDFNLYGGEFEEFHDFNEGMKYAQKHNKPVFIDFSGFACVNCRKMEGAVFDKAEVRESIEKNFVMIKLMVDDKTKLSKPIIVKENNKEITLETVGDKWAYLQRYKFDINSQPYYALLNNDGQILNNPRVYDENVKEFVDWLNDGIKIYTDSKTTNN